jgi:hypothetical protein
VAEEFESNDVEGHSLEPEDVEAPEVVEDDDDEPDFEGHGFIQH